MRVRSSTPPLPPQLILAKAVIAQYSLGWGGAYVPVAALPYPPLPAFVRLRPPASTVPAGWSDLGRLVALLSLNHLLPICVTQSVPCYIWPHPLIGSTCVYLSNAMVISTRPEVTFYLLLCGRSLPCSCSRAPSSLIKEPPASPPAGHGHAAEGHVSGTVERCFGEAFLRGGGSVPFFLPPSCCLECSAAPRSLTPWGGG